MLGNIKKIFSAFTKKELLCFTAAAALAVASAVILAFVVLEQKTAVVPASGGDYKEGFVGQPVYVNPVIAQSEIDKDLVKLIFSGLTDVADTIDKSPDGRTWDIRLKENIFWQDREKLTSDDVIFTIQKIQDLGSVSPLYPEWQGVAVSRLSELELQLTLASPYAFFADNLKNLYILPKHLFAETPAANWRLSDFNLNPVGSGPYRFSSYEKQNDGFITAYHLRANTKYFGGAPLVQTFTFEFFGKSGDSVKTFNAGLLDGMAAADTDLLNQIKRPYNLFSYRLPSYYALFFNQGKNPALGDPAVRKAADSAINKQNLVAEALGGNGEVMNGPILPKSPYFNSALSQNNFSPDAANQLLDQAGWKMGPDGFRIKTTDQNQANLTATLTVPQIGFLVKTAEIVRDSLQKIGFQINLDIRPANEAAGDVIKNRDYEILLFGNASGENPDLFPFWHSSQRFYPGLNLSLYNNKKADSLIEAIRQNLDDASRLQEVYDLQSTIANDEPAVFLYSPDYLFLADKNLGGPKTGLISAPSDRFLNAKDWYLNAARVLK